MRRISLSPTAALTATLLIAVSASLGAYAQEQTGSIHGHVQNTVGIPMTDGIIGVATPGDKTAKYTFNTDANGDYKGSGIAPGTYTVFLRQPTTAADKVVDQIPEVKITAGGDTLQDFDLTRPAYLATLTPEQRKEAEEVRAKNASAVKDNAVIKNLNANLMKAREDNAKGRKGNCIGANGSAILGTTDPASCTSHGGTPNDFQQECSEAETIMAQATGPQGKPDAPVLWVELGNAQFCLKKYDDAVTSLKKAIDLDAASKKPNPEVQGGAGNTLGEALANLKKVDDAQAAYEAAAKVNPTQAGMYYQNEAIIMSRTGNTDATVAAADKAIAAAPDKPTAYYLKGQALINKATVDPKTGKIVAPPGCAEAYQKYLELAPDGPFANDAKAVLGEMGQTVKTSYKAKK
jgi:tetratricopeptide (TPR) repeat protein